MCWNYKWWTELVVPFIWGSRQKLSIQISIELIIIHSPTEATVCLLLQISLSHIRPGKCFCRSSIPGTEDYCAIIVSVPDMFKLWRTRGRCRMLRKPLRQDCSNKNWRLSEGVLDSLLLIPNLLRALKATLRNIQNYVDLKGKFRLVDIEVFLEMCGDIF